MFFSKIILTNFGAHKYLELDNLGHVVGIIGPSGRGKTTIFQAIELLLTGKIEKSDAIETFVHDFGVEGAAEEACVEGWFGADGQTGYIKRTFGVGNKRATRLLQWADDKPLTGDTDVSKRLGELFDVGKRSLAATVFLRQGEIKNGLFTTPAQREDLLMRILSLEYMTGIGTAATKKRTAVLANLPDLTPARDQASFAYNRAFEDHTNADIELKSTIDFRPDIETVHAFHMAKTACETAASQLQESTLAAASQQQHIAALLAEAPAIASVEEFRTWVSAAETKASESAARLTTLHQQLQMVQTRNTLIATRAELTTRVQSLTAEQPTLTMLCPPGKLEGLQNMARAVYTRTAIEARLANLRSTLGATEASIIELGARPLVMDPPTADMSRHEQRMEELQPLRALKAALEKAGGHVGCGECPTCNAALDPTKFDASIFAKAAEDFQHAQSEIRRLRQAVSDNAAAVARWDVDHGIRAKTVENTNTQIAATELELEANPAPSEVPANLQEQIEQQVKLQQRLDTLQAQLPSVQAELARVEAQINGMPADLPEIVSTEVQAAEANADQAHKNTLILRLRTLEAAAAQIAGSDALLAARQVTLDSARAAQSLSESKLTKVAADSLRLHNHSISDALVDLNQKQASRLTAEATMKMSAATMADASSRLQGLDAQIAAQARRRIVADKLERLSKAFSRSGVPTAIVQDRWTLLMALTQAYLRQSDAPFSIRVSPNVSVSADFLLHKRPSAGYRPMTKMSGGQGMVFAVRFAFAVQQLLTPKLGLLSLDEPSTHLDSDGVAQLGEVLQGLGARLQNASSQIWVADHNPRLTPSFTTVIELPELENEGI